MAWPSDLPHGVLTDESPATPDAHTGYHNGTRAFLSDLRDELGDGPKGTDPDLTSRLGRMEGDFQGSYGPAAQGLRAWTDPVTLWPLNSITLAAGTLYLAEMVVPAGAVNGVLVDVATAASLTYAYVAAFNLASGRLAVSANQSALLSTVGLKEVNLTAGISLAETTVLRFGVLCSGGIALRRTGSGSSVNARRTSAQPRFATANTGITTMPNPHAGMALSNTAIGMAVYA